MTVDESTSVYITATATKFHVNEDCLKTMMYHETELGDLLDGAWLGCQNCCSEEILEAARIDR